MYEILPNLYLSSFNDAQVAANKQEFFQINVTKDIPMLKPNNHRIAIDDDQSTCAFYFIIPPFVNKGLIRQGNFFPCVSSCEFMGFLLCFYLGFSIFQI